MEILVLITKLNATFLVSLKTFPYKQKTQYHLLLKKGIDRLAV